MGDLDIPGDLMAHAVWSSATGGDRPDVVYVTERNRRRRAAWLPVLPLMLATAGYAFQEPSSLTAASTDFGRSRTDDGLIASDRIRTGEPATSPTSPNAAHTGS